MNKTALDALLEFPESLELEWKAAFPAALAKGRKDLGWDAGKATILRDLVALANSIRGGVGYLVYGVKDSGSARKPIGISSLLDDADYQTWSERIFDPPPNFEYARIPYAGVDLGVFEISVHPRRPHIVLSNLGGVIYEGQLWIRRGTKNVVALRSEIEDLFVSRKPLWSSRSNSSLIERIGKHYQDLGYVTSLARVGKRDSLIGEGYEFALDPVTAQHVYAGGTELQPELVMLVKKLS